MGQDVNSVFGLEKVDWWNPIRTFPIQSRSCPMLQTHNYILHMAICMYVLGKEMKTHRYDTLKTRSQKNGRSSSSSSSCRAATSWASRCPLCANISSNSDASCPTV